MHQVHFCANFNLFLFKHSKLDLRNSLVMFGGRRVKVEIVADVDSTKADSDKKSYRLIRLPNGLRALLIHDPPAAPR